MPARILAILVVFSPLLAPASQIPVFRYALERWVADNYELVVFHQGGLGEEQQRMLEGSEVLIDKTLPPPEGAGALVIAKVPAAALADVEKPAATDSPKKPEAKFGSPLLTNMMWLVGVLLVALMAITIFMKRSSVR
jgi:hypothetical protein